MAVTRTRKFYPSHTKKEAVRRFRLGEKTDAIAEAMGISRNLIQNWVKPYRTRSRGPVKPIIKPAPKAAAAVDPLANHMEHIRAHQAALFSQYGNRAAPAESKPDVPTARIVLTSTSFSDAQKVAIVTALLK